MSRLEIDRFNSRANTPGVSVKISLFRNDAGPMAKRISLGPDGALLKQPCAQMSMGEVEVVETSFPELPEFLASLKPNQAIGLGIPGCNRARIVSADRALADPGALVRNQGNFRFPEGPGLCYLDGDTAATLEKLTAAISAVLLTFSGVEKLAVFSASSGIYRIGEDRPVAESKGIHLYFPVLDCRDIPRFGRALCRRLWLAGYGHTEISRAGTLLVRQIIDAATFSAERIIFEAPPILGEGLERRPPEPIYIPGEQLDTSLCPDLSPEEEKEYHRLVVDAKAAAALEAQPIRDAWLHERGQEIALKRNIPYGEARRIAVEAAEGRALEGDFILHFRRFGNVAVADIVKDAVALAKYDEQILHDPMEPDYGSPFCAICYTNNGINPLVFSQAHGGRTFPLAIPAVSGRAVTSPANGQNGGRPPTTKLLADGFLQSEGTPFPIKRHRGQWFRYDGRIYRPMTNDDLKGKVMAFLRNNHPGHATKNMGTNIIEHLLAVDVAGVESRHAMPCWLPSGESATGWIATSNCLVNVDALARRINGVDVSESDTVRPHTEKLLSTFALQYKFDPNAECPQWMAYLAGVQPDPAMQEMLQLLAGLALVPDTSYEVFFVLYGDGGCGKTVFLFVLENLVGPSNVCTLPLTKFAEKHSTHLLCEHLLNIVGDLPTSDGRTSLHAIEGVLKDVASGGLLACERKNQEPFQGHAIARCIFAANSLPNFADRSSGIWDRMRIVPFDIRFRGTEKQNPNLARDIVASELPGIFNWAVRGLAKLRTMRQFPRGKRGEELEAQHRRDCDHEQEFLSDRCEVVPGALLETQSVYGMYKLWAESSGYRPKNVANFTRDLRRVFPEAVEERRRVEGRRVRGFLNLRMLNEPGAFL